ncbi:MAG: amidohydrolase family protein [Pirellulales bacterium]|nr:amidohydrolase family protein [Pirellulales bacterium]
MKYSLRARWILPVAGPPIDGGCVTIQDDRILSVGREIASPKCHDLGDVALLPGLINAHTHLDLSDVDAPLGRPGMEMVDWLGHVIQHRFAHPATPATVEKGLYETARLGTTTLADVAQDAPPAEMVESLGVELWSFLELIGPTANRITPQLERAESHLAAGARSKSWHAGLSPHAPYSVLPDLLVRAAALSAERHAPLAMHLAESREELEFVRHGQGPFRRMLENLDACDDGIASGGLSMLDYLRTLAGAYRALVIHGNYLADEDIAFLAGRADRMAVVYCPRTHAFFGHDPYPLEKMLAAGTTIALGTDSRASSPDLGLLGEIREALRRHPTVAPETIVRLATLGGAAALGQKHRLGTIEPGRRADLVAVALPTQSRTPADPYRLLLESDAPVAAAWRRGRPTVF